MADTFTIMGKSVKKMYVYAAAAAAVAGFLMYTQKGKDIVSEVTGQHPAASALGPAL